jgi:tetratricopeptide (TPR) repeat protein
MKRLVIGLALCALAAAHVAAQDTFTTETDHYRVVSYTSQEQADLTANKLEALLELFNSYFHFDLTELPSRMTVRVFAEKASFDSYLNRVIDETREDFVYLHYTDRERSELVAFSREEGFDASLNHQSFIQYLRSFVANPPLWMREGFAVFFERSTYDPDFQAMIYRENLAWLETLKNLVSGRAPVEPLSFSEVLSADVELARERIDAFYPQAWGIVSFLLNSRDRNHTRVLWDSMSALSPDATLEENNAAIRNQVLRFVDTERLVNDYVSYVDSRRSFRGLVQDGIDQYAAGELESSEQSFVQALNLRDDNHVPYYYLGLISYDRGNYELARFYYQEALSQGSEEALTYYALGVNAFAANELDSALSFLQQSRELDPEAYGDRAEELINRIEG